MDAARVRERPVQPLGRGPREEVVIGTPHHTQRYSAALQLRLDAEQWVRLELGAVGMELRIECTFPADDMTASTCRELFGAAA